MTPPSVALIELGCDRPELNEPIGIETIASYIHGAEGIPPDQVTVYWQKLEQRSFRVRESPRPGIVGVSAQINTLDQLTVLYRDLTEYGTDVPIVIGNLLALYATEDLLGRFPRAILCIGEGELVFARIYAALRVAGNHELFRRSLRDISGIAFRNGGINVRNCSVLSDIKSIPPPRRDFVPDLIQLNGIVRVEGSRGCHWGRCEFCSVASRFGLGGYRRFPTSRILKDLETLSSLGVRSAYFSDEDFFGHDYDASAQIACEIQERKRCGTIADQMTFFVSVLASDVTNPSGLAALRQWKAAGLREVFVGIEAGAEDEIRRFVKKASAATNTSAVQTLLSLGFQVDIGFIMFEPRMTIENLATNVEWLRRQSLSSIDSRVTKRLRIQPQTALASTYGDLVTGPLCVDELSYPYRFEDARVEWVAEEFRLWEDRTKESVYSLLASARGEVRDERERTLRKRQLGRIRDLDLIYLEHLIACARKTSDLADLRRVSMSVSTKKLEVLKRAEMLAQS